MRIERNITTLLTDVEVRRVVGNTEGEVAAMTFDSRSVAQGDVFFAIKGEKVDGHNYIAGAVERGARMIVCEQIPEQTTEGVCYVEVANTNIAMGRMASAYWGHPSRALTLVGVTGTNGKTTTATLLYNLMRALGYRAGLISTVRYVVDTRSVESTHTTPDALRLNAMLAEMVEAGCDYCFMEVSSHSIVQHRIECLRFLVKNIPL